MTIAKKAQMISAMTEELAENAGVYDMVLYAKDGRHYNVLYGNDGIGQQQSRAGLKRQIQTIRAELLELDKLING